MKKIAVSLIVLGMMAFGAVSLAAPKATGTSVNLGQNILDEIKRNRIMTREEFEAKTAEIKNLMEQKQAELRNQIQTKREKLQAQIEAKRKELRNRLAKIKDEHKKQIVERVYIQVNELNKRITDHFLNVLERLEKVLERISSRAAKAEANGQDISAVKTAITEATNAINAAKTAVQNQASKVYSVTVNTESSLKTDVGKTRQTLHNDLKNVFNLVRTAQEAVRKAATTLAQIPNIDELEIPATQPATTTQPTP